MVQTSDAGSGESIDIVFEGLAPFARFCKTLLLKRQSSGSHAFCVLTLLHFKLQTFLGSHLKLPHPPSPITDLQPFYISIKLTPPTPQNRIILLKYF